MVEREMTMCFGHPWTDRMNLSGFQTYLFTTNNRDLFRAINFWTVFAFLFDDYLDQIRDQSVLNEWYNKYKTGHSDDDNSMDRILVKARSYIDRYLSQNQLKRHMDYFLGFIQTYNILTPYKHNTSSRLMTYDEFFAIREKDCGGVAVFIWAELSARFDPDHYNLRDNDLFQAFTSTCIKHCVLVNEIYSFRKEVRAGDTRHNYVYLIMAREGVSAQLAVDRIVCEIHGLWVLAMDYGKQLNEFNNPALDRYVCESLHVTKGNYYWSSICARYKV
ncbi:unnamed protein product [Medioppia subpectinata]|uniref:Terpene synthase n=1 Tax=Medioppia subpectinata TaxID=1979941 RepID=A0A7R9Q9S5_9ACAR|nr:unnamed protein product [Medioppia subpectinata]CAG2116600.1 unnamed protein product [Medioppia subpectinata]